MTKDGITPISKSEEARLKTFTLLSSKLGSLVRFLYNRLALVIHCDSRLSSITLPWQLLSVIKVVLFYQLLLLKL